MIFRVNLVTNTKVCQKNLFNATNNFLFSTLKTSQWKHFLIHILLTFLMYWAISLFLNQKLIYNRRFGIKTEKN